MAIYSVLTIKTYFSKITVFWAMCYTEAVDEPVSSILKGQQVPLRCWCLCTKQHGTISQKTTTLIFTAIRTSNLSSFYKLQPSEYRCLSWCCVVHE